MKRELFSIDCTGDVVAGDTILFSEAVWPSYRPSGRWGRRLKAHPLGERTVIALVLRDSYGARKQQHTFTIRIIECEGYDAIAAGAETTRKGRNIYRNGVRRLRSNDESARQISVHEKHARGDDARQARANRRLLDEVRGTDDYWPTLNALAGGTTK